MGGSAGSVLPTGSPLALGMPPSRWAPAVPFPEPGSPFDPDQGWDAFDESRETVASPAAYPPGVTAAGGCRPRRPRLSGARPEE